MRLAFPDDDDDERRHLTMPGPRPRPAWTVFGVRLLVAIAFVLALEFGVIAILSLIRRLG